MKRIPMKGTTRCFLGQPCYSYSSTQTWECAHTVLCMSVSAITWHSTSRQITREYLHGVIQALHSW